MRYFITSKAIGQASCRDVPPQALVGVAVVENDKVTVYNNMSDTLSYKLRKGHDHFCILFEDLPEWDGGFPSWYGRRQIRAAIAEAVGDRLAKRKSPAD